MIKPLNKAIVWDLQIIFSVVNFDDGALPLQVLVDL